MLASLLTRCKSRSNWNGWTSFQRTRAHPFNGPFSGTTRVGRYQKGGTNLDFTEARDSEWQWHQLGSMQVCTSLQTDNHASTSPLNFLQAGCPSCRPTSSVKALKAISVARKQTRMQRTASTRAAAAHDRVAYKNPQCRTQTDRSVVTTTRYDTIRATERLTCDKAWVDHVTRTLSSSVNKQQSCRFSFPTFTRG